MDGRLAIDPKQSSAWHIHARSQAVLHYPAPKPASLITFTKSKAGMLKRVMMSTTDSAGMPPCPGGTSWNTYPNSPLFSTTATCVDQPHSPTLRGWMFLRLAVRSEGIQSVLKDRVDSAAQLKTHELRACETHPHPATFFRSCSKLPGLGSKVMIVALGYSRENWSADNPIFPPAKGLRISVHTGSMQPSP